MFNYKLLVFYISPITLGVVDNLVKAIQYSEGFIAGGIKKVEVMEH